MFFSCYHDEKLSKCTDTNQIRSKNSILFFSFQLKFLLYRNYLFKVTHKTTKRFQGFIFLLTTAFQKKKRVKYSGAPGLLYPSPSPYPTSPSIRIILSALRYFFQVHISFVDLVVRGGNEKLYVCIVFLIYSIPIHSS